MFPPIPDETVAQKAPPPPPIQPGQLPGVLAGIARAISVDVALALARELGGLRVSLPKGAVNPESALAKAIGLEHATRVRDLIGHGSFKIPSAIVFLHYHDARRLRAEGWSHVAIARELRISLRRVERLLSRDKRANSPTREVPRA